ncbi:unnamed protein product [Peronospora effusa]|nr:unnamed protein product [Peronospora effusa]
MRYALIKFRVYLLGEKMFSIYTYHASLRTAVKSPHLSQRMPGKNNILADALSRRPDYDPRRDMGHQTEYVDDDEYICACCIELGLNAMISNPCCRYELRSLNSTRMIPSMQESSTISGTRAKNYSRS